MKMKTNINEFYDDIILSDFYEEPGGTCSMIIVHI